MALGYSPASSGCPSVLAPLLLSLFSTTTSNPASVTLDSNVASSSSLPRETPVVRAAPSLVVGARGLGVVEVSAVLLVVAAGLTVSSVSRLAERMVWGVRGFGCG